MSTTFADEGIRERLLLAGIHEIELHGINDFSMRRVASACEVSCAAPYRHFKGRDELVSAIISYINSCWDMMARQIALTYEGDCRKQLVETCVGYVRFFTANPKFFSVMLSVKGGSEHGGAKTSPVIFELLHKFCARDALGREDEARLSFLIDSLTCGAAIALKDKSSAECDRGIEFLRTELEKMF